MSDSIVTYGAMSPKTKQMPVFLDGKKIGVIEQNLPTGYRYLAGGRKKFAGEWFHTLNKVKESLEAE